MKKFLLLIFFFFFGGYASLYIVCQKCAVTQRCEGGNTGQVTKFNQMFVSNLIHFPQINTELCGTENKDFTGTGAHRLKKLCYKLWFLLCIPNKTSIIRPSLPPVIPPVFPII